MWAIVVSPTDPDPQELSSFVPYFSGFLNAGSCVHYLCVLILLLFSISEPFSDKLNRPHDLLCVLVYFDRISF